MMAAGQDRIRFKLLQSRNNMMEFTPYLKLDHIAIAARTLDEGAAYIKKVLGIDMPTGGAHPVMGTHNRLMSLGQNCFLELIAIDPKAPPISRHRWFDLDRFDADPLLSTWVVSTIDIAEALLNAHPSSGSTETITRGELKWQISVPNDGSMPLDGAFPTLIEWPEGEHPAATMVDLGCRLRSLVVEHPDADQINSLIGHLVDRSFITIRFGTKKMISAEIETLTGLKNLS